MKKLIVILGLCLAFNANSQTVKKDPQGNYYASKEAPKGSEAKPTGKTYTDTKGNVYPVMISKNGKLFVVRTSKKGTKYNQYLKL